MVEINTGIRTECPKSPTIFYVHIYIYICDILRQFQNKLSTHFRTNQSTYIRGGRDSSVGIATLYGLEPPGIKSRWWRDFPHPFRPALGPAKPPVQWIPGLFLGVKRPGLRVEHPLLSSSEAEEKVKLYICTPSGFHGLFWSEFYLMHIYIYIYIYL